LICTEIVLEYEEVIGHKMGRDVATDVVHALESFPNVLKISRYYQWNVIEDDPDDNKFLDLAIAGGSDCIVTNDKHFNILRKVDFPRVAVVNPEEFKYLIGAS